MYFFPKYVLVRQTFWRDRLEYIEFVLKNVPSEHRLKLNFCVPRWITLSIQLCFNDHMAERRTTHSPFENIFMWVLHLRHILV